MHVLNVQLAGGAAPRAAHTPSVPCFVSVLQLESAITVWLNTATRSFTQAEYSPTVAMHPLGKSLQPGLLLSAAAGSARQPVSFSPQLALSCSSVGALLEVAKESPFHLQAFSVLMAVLKCA